MTEIPFAAWAPVVLLVIGWVGYCWYDISRREVEHLPKWAWALISLFSVPIGGIVYFLVGRKPQ